MEKEVTQQRFLPHMAALELAINLMSKAREFQEEAVAVLRYCSILA